MASSSLLSNRRALPRLPKSPLVNAHIFSVLLPSATPLLFSRPSGQRRSIFWCSRRHDREWRSRAQTRLERSIEDKKQPFYKYVTHESRRRPCLYQFKRGKCGWEKDAWQRYRPHETHTNARDSESLLREVKEMEKQLEELKRTGRWGVRPLTWGVRALVQELEHIQKVEESEKATKTKESDFNKGFEEFKRSIDQDPYGAIFGRRLQPFPFGIKQGSWLAFYKSLFGKGNSKLAQEVSPKFTINAEEPQPRKIKINDGQPLANGATDSSSKFDPITGRMVPVKTKSDSTTNDNVETRSWAGDGKENPGIPASQDHITEQPKPESSSDLDVNRPRTNSVSTDSIREDTGEVWLMGGPEETPSSSVESRNSDILTPHTKDELSERSPPPSTQEDKPTVETKPSAYPSRLAPLEGHLSSVDRLSEAETRKPNRESPVRKAKKLSYDHNDDRTEDLDLLRPSDVRASFKTHKASQDIENKKKSRKDLEKSFCASQAAECGFDVDELRKIKVLGGEGKVQPPIPEEPAGMDEYPRLTPAVDRMQRPESRSDNQGSPREYDGESGRSQRTHNSEKMTKIEKELLRIQELNNDIKFSLGQSDTDLVVAVGLGRMMAKRREQLEKIGGMLDEIEQMNSSITFVVKELRDAMYQRMDDPSSHNQPPTPTRYRVLAYDSLTMEVKDAGVSSAHSDDISQLHPADALSRLKNPSPFLGFFPLLEAQGYELVSGGGDILIFKKVREDTSAPTLPNAARTTTAKTDNEMLHSPAQAAQLEREAIDQVESKTNEQPAAASSLPEFESPSQAPKTLLDESFYTDGRSNWFPYEFPYDQEPRQPPEAATPLRPSPSSSNSTPPRREKPSRVRKTVRRVFLTGVVAAGTCYAFGVIAEYFRTGGQDGLGPQGFTGLEGR
ncbi:hypothetical protein FQN52_008426 [Onygenales sp. PD_12]|nr:hypothetical protein FQN52_008426 [Onygenales sp. PD_12]KAK2795623.1 hypothetical protein FQN51_000380 [Onygenales sp. PD_10]